MADEEAKEDEVKQNQNVDPDEEGLPVEEEAAAPAGPARTAGARITHHARLDAAV